MASDRSYQLAKLPAISGEAAQFPLPTECRTLYIYNALAAPIYGRWGPSSGGKVPTPTATSWDFAAPGNAYIVVPVVAEAEACSIAAIYPGSIPAADVQAVVYGSDVPWSPNVGPLA